MAFLKAKPIVNLPLFIIPIFELHEGHFIIADFNLKSVNYQCTNHMLIKMFVMLASFILVGCNPIISNVNFFVKDQYCDGKVKSSKFKAREFRVMRRT